MDIREAGKKYLQPLVPLIDGKHNQEIFEKYISGLMLENKNFSTLEVSEKTDDDLKREYLDRRDVEVFHRETKQKLGLEKMLVRSFRRLINRIGLICIVYSFLSGLKKQLNISIGKVKRIIQNSTYSTQDSADRLACLAFS